MRYPGAAGLVAARERTAKAYFSYLSSSVSVDYSVSVSVDYSFLLSFSFRRLLDFDFGFRSLFIFPIYLP